VEQHLLPHRVEEAEIYLADKSVHDGEANVVVIASEKTSFTRLERLPIQLDDGFPVWPGGEDLACVTVVSRDGSKVSTGVVKNLGLRRGAFAASFAHDSQNLLIIGRTREEMALAANEVIRRQGALVVQEGARVAAALDLPYFGLLSDEPFEAVADGLESVERALAGLGMTRERPFLMLSLLSLSVSPLYKFSDRGIIDTEGRQLLRPFDAAR
jgi:adenine deaminase